MARASIHATIDPVDQGGEPGVGGRLPFLGLLIAMASGLVMSAGFVIELPVALLLAMAVAFVAGCALLIAALVRDTRRSGQSWPHAARRGIGAGLRWFVRLLP
jgi:xanthine/uracil/vitamin C permease (AzgA family)